ncbi:MAG: PAS domain S-box protein [Candidatus Tenebribacter davisii]|nr:PAS domain S-box protein [Candidatus Tenebribacter davisii]
MKKAILLTFFFILLSTLSLTAKEKLHVKIGVYENAPKIYTNENGEMSGFWADVTKHIADREYWEIEWVHGTWDQCLKKLETNEIDIMIDVAITPARENKFSFNKETVLLSWTRLYTKRGLNFQTILDIEGKKIAGLKNSINIEGPEGLKDLINKFDINCDIIEMDDYVKVFEALNNNEADVGITNKDFGAKHEKDYKVKRTPIIFQPASMHYACSINSKLTPYYLEQLDFHIKKLKKDQNSIFYISMDKYLGEHEKITSFPLWLKITIALMLSFALIIFVFNRILKHQIVKKTAQLKKSEAQFKLFAENVPGVVRIYRWYSDEHREYIYQGPGMEKIVGEELAKKIYKDYNEYFKLIPEDDLKALNEASLKAFHTGKNLDFEYRLTINDSNIRWVRALFSAFQIEDGVFLWQGLINDITERKQLEKELIESENKYRALAETSSDIIITLDMEGNFTYISPASKKITGFNWKHFLGRPFMELIVPEFVELSIESFKKGLTGKKIPLYEIEILHKNGSKIPVELNVSNLFDIKGNVIGRLAMVRDISERKIAENALAESEEKYRAIFESTGTATMIVNEETTIVQVNRECEVITGFAASELIGKSWTEFVYKEDLQIMLNRQKSRYEDKESVPDKYEVRLIDSKGDIRNTILSIGVIPNVKRSAVSMLDITDLKKAEEELKSKINELEIFNEASVDREVTINELRKEINELLKQIGKETKYDIVY